MKRFLLFEWEQLNAEGGFRDWVDSFDTLEEVKLACLTRVFDADNPNVFVVRQVVDQEREAVVAEQFGGKWADGEEVTAPEVDIAPDFEAERPERLQGRLF